MTKQIVPVHARDNCFDDHGLPRGKDTGIDVERGQILCIRVSSKDTWSIAGREASANGQTGVDPSEHRINAYDYYYRKDRGLGRPPWFVAGCLVGSLDDGQTFFPVGTALTMEALTPGRLTLYCWCGANARNSGSLNVEVEVLEHEAYDVDRVYVDKVRVDVYADRHSTGVGKGKTAGLTVKPGDVLTIFVGDEGASWKEGDDSTSEIPANGDENENVEVSGFLFPLTALIGSLDAGRYYFPIGRHLEMTALSEGSLTLFCASDTPSDNRAFITVYAGAAEAVDPGALADVEISYVNKSADLAREYIKIVNKGPRPVNLARWYLTGKSDAWNYWGAYRLGSIDLDRGAEIKIYTKKPNASAARGEYDMNRDESMAPGPGEEIKLFDDQRNEIFVYPPGK